LNTESQAKQEISEAYDAAKAAGAVDDTSAEGHTFGRVCVKWHDWYVVNKPKDKGDRIRFMWKALGIPHTTAYHWMGIYRKTSGEKPPIVEYTREELEHQERKKTNEERLLLLFAECGFPTYVKQNCATNELHFNVIFSALTETEVRSLAELVDRRGK